MGGRVGEDLRGRPAYDLPSAADADEETAASAASTGVVPAPLCCSVAIVGSGLAALSTAVSLLRQRDIATTAAHPTRQKMRRAPSSKKAKTSNESMENGTETIAKATTRLKCRSNRHGEGDCDGLHSLHRSRPRYPRALPSDGEGDWNDGRGGRSSYSGTPGLSPSTSRPSTPPLQRISITLYERDESFGGRKEGYGLTLKYDPDGGILGPSRLDVLEELCRWDCPSRSHYILDWQGNVLGYYGNAFLTSFNPDDRTRRHRGGFGQRGNLRVPRQQVRKILLQKLLDLSSEHGGGVGGGVIYDVRILWGHRLVDLRPVDDPPSASRSKVSSPLPKMRLYFSNGDVADADWVIGADGIRSSVVRCVLPNLPPPRPLGVRLIVGLCQLPPNDPLIVQQHASLLDERGFYTHAPGRRLFVMPYSAASPLRPDELRRYMWQLSFVDNEQPQQHTSLDDTPPPQLLDLALDKCRGWHDPVPQLLRSTPVDTIWSSHLCDRDPNEIYEMLLPPKGIERATTAALLPVLIVGDALHAMSCFKGQGAHQALRDGWCAAQWWHKHATQRKCSAAVAVRGCARELVQRTASIVIDSRQAAQDLHQICVSEGGVEHQSFAGLADSQRVRGALQALRDHNVRPGSVEHLDRSVAQILRHLGYLSVVSGTTSPPEIPPPPDPWKRAALRAAQTCDLPLLRRLSWESQHSQWMQCVADDRDNTCLHLAVQAASVAMAMTTAASRTDEEAGGGADECSALHLEDCIATVHWLVTEAGCDIRAHNLDGHQPKDAARNGTPQLQQLLHNLEDIVAQRERRHSIS